MTGKRAMFALHLFAPVRRREELAFEPSLNESIVGFSLHAGQEIAGTIKAISVAAIVQTN